MHSCNDTFITELSFATIAELKLSRTGPTTKRLYCAPHH